MPERILYLESVAGIAGDMFTAAFVDAGLVDAAELQTVPGLLGFQGVEVEVTRAERAGARCTRVRVVPPVGAVGGRGTDGGHLVLDVHGHSHPHDHLHEAGGHGHIHGEGPHSHSHAHHPYTTLVERIRGSGLSTSARAFALWVFRLLAEAEADAHGVPVDEVVFHEVGAVDSVVDVAMAALCVEGVAAGRVLASPVKLGRGTILIEHGTHPVPPPASARLAVGMPVASVPEAITRADVELSTPTGLAILRALDPTFVDCWPRGTLKAQGSGTGALDLGEYPNIFRVAVLEEEDVMAESSVPSGGSKGRTHLASPEPVEGSEGETSLPYETDEVVELRCNVDDQTGERTAWVLEKALDLGALDAWAEPIVGKKGRPAACIALLSPPESASVLADFLLRHTTTFGVRYARWDRLKLVRRLETRDTARGPLTFKVGSTTDGKVLKEKPEFEDLKVIWEEDPDYRP